MKSHYTKAGSMPIAEVGRKIRLSQQRLLHSDLSSLHSAWRVWAACSILTASWSKGSDRVHVVTIANLAGLRPDKVSPILRKFHEQGIFGWVKDTGSRQPGILSLPSLGERELAAPRTPREDTERCWVEGCHRPVQQNSDACDHHYSRALHRELFGEDT